MTHRYSDVENEGNPAPAQTPGTLESDVGPAVYQELLASFLTHLSLQKAELTDAAVHGDVRAAQHVAHQIKGTALSFAAVRLDGFAQRVLHIDGDQVELLRSLVDEISAEIETLQAAIRV
jgi:HPt (histidine-containing phosphotransfer) domain-containing protein